MALTDVVAINSESDLASLGPGNLVYVRIGEMPYQMIYQERSAEDVLSFILVPKSRAPPFYVYSDKASNVGYAFGMIVFPVSGFSSKEVSPDSGMYSQVKALVDILY